MLPLKRFCRLVSVGPRISPSFRSCYQVSDTAQSALHEPRYDFRRHRRGLQPSRIVRMVSDQNPGLKRLDRQRLALEYLVGDFKARTLEAFDLAFDGDPVAMGRWDVEFCPRIYHRDADQAVAFHDILFGEHGGLEHYPCRVVQHREI